MFWEGQTFCASPTSWKIETWFGVWGLGFGVYDFGFSVWGFEVRVQRWWSGVQGSGLDSRDLALIVRAGQSQIGTQCTHDEHQIATEHQILVLTIHING